MAKNMFHMQLTYFSAIYQAPWKWNLDWSAVAWDPANPKGSSVSMAHFVSGCLRCCPF